MQATSPNARACAVIFPKSEIVAELRSELVSAYAGHTKDLHKSMKKSLTYARWLIVSRCTAA